MGKLLWTLQVLGPFRLSMAGQRVEIRSRRGQALLAMLASAPDGERTRTWLQDHLWGSRDGEHAQASLRRELANLRKVLNSTDGAPPLLLTNGLTVALDLDRIAVDLRRGDHHPSGDFLEGLDIAGEEGFEDWLRLERANLENSQSQSSRSAFHFERPPSATDDAALTSLALDTAKADAATEMALIDRLSRLHWLALRFSNSAEPARFACTAQVQENGALALRLTETASERLLWSALLLPTPDAPGGLTLADQAVASLRARIALAEQEAARRNDPGLPERASLIWRSQRHMHQLTARDSALANALCDQALALDPDCSEARIQAAWVHIWDLWVGRAQDRPVIAAREMAQRIIIGDHEDARGHMLAGIAEIWLKQPLRAEVSLRRAIELDPSLIMARVQLSCALSNRLAVEEAEAHLHCALALGPNDQYLFFTAGELATVCLMQEKWDEALLHAETALTCRRSYLHGHVARINALVRLGLLAEAGEAHRELYRINPRYRPEFIDWIPFLDSTWNDFLKDGLNRAAAACD